MNTTCCCNASNLWRSKPKKTLSSRLATQASQRRGHQYSSIQSRLKLCRTLLRNKTCRASQLFRGGPISERLEFQLQLFAAVRRPEQFTANKSARATKGWILGQPQSQRDVLSHPPLLATAILSPRPRSRVAETGIGEAAAH